jgi:glucose/arabinose dehydrogenase
MSFGPGRLSVLSLLAAMLTVSIASSATAATSRVVLHKLASGYDHPVLVTQPRSGADVLFVVEQTGKIKRATYRDGVWKKRGTFLDLTSKVLDPDQNEEEQGLLGLAFDPDYRKNGLFYVDYTRRGQGARKGDTVLAEYRRRNARSADPSSRRVLMVVDQPGPSHNGGNLVFGPDGLLYLGLADGQEPADPNEAAQDLRWLLGKMLRIDPRDPDRGGPRAYRVPRSNPYVGKPGRNEIWSSGFRNPWRFSFDRQNGNLWIGDVGEHAREEVNRAAANRSGMGAGKGMDFGWDDCEGSLEFEADEGDADDACEHDDLPVYEYQHGPTACAVIGGHVHRGPTDRRWRGLYVAADLCGRLFVLDQRGRVRISSEIGMPIQSFGEDARGNIFAVDRNGDLYRVRFRGPRPPSPG